MYRVPFSKIILLILFSVSEIQGICSPPQAFLQIDQKEIPRSLFQSNFLKFKQDHPQAVARQFFPVFLENQLKIKEAEDLQLDTLADFKRTLKQELKKCIRQNLDNQGFQDSLIHHFYTMMQFHVSLSYLFIRFPESAAPDDTLHSWQQAQQDADLLRHGTSLQKFIRDNQDSLVSGGKLGTFGPFDLNYKLSKVAFQLPQKTFSHPIRTSFGYQLLRVDHIDSTSKPLAPFYKIKDWIHHRMLLIPDIQKTINRHRLKQLLQISQATIDTIQLSQAIEDWQQAWDGQKITLNRLLHSQVQLIRTPQQEFGQSGQLAVFMDQNRISPPQTKKDCQQLIVNYLFTCIDQHPELILSKEILHQLRDSLLLEKINIQQVWLKARNDSAGLRSFYRHYRGERPQWGPRFKGWVVRCSNQQTKDFAQQLLTSYTLTPQEAYDLINEDYPNQVELTYGAFERGQDPVVDYFMWAGPRPSATALFDFIRGKLIPPEVKKLSEARGFYLHAFQRHTEKRWIKTLKQTHRIRWSREQLNSIHG